MVATLVERFRGPTLGPPGSCRPQVGPMSAPGTLLSGYINIANTLGMEKVSMRETKCATAI